MKSSKRVMLVTAVGSFWNRPQTEFRKKQEADTKYRPGKRKSVVKHTGQEQIPVSYQCYSKNEEKLSLPVVVRNLFIS